MKSRIFFVSITLLILFSLFYVVFFNSTVIAQDTEGSVDSQTGSTDSFTSDTGYNWDDYTSGWGDNVDNLDSFVDAFNSVADSLSGDSSIDYSSSLGDSSDIGGGGSTPGFVSFQDIIDDILSGQTGLGQQAGTNPGGAMGLGDLSNLNPTIDNGVVASFEGTDPCTSCDYPKPVLSATTSCIGSQPVVNLSWTLAPVASNTFTLWQIMREPDFTLPATMHTDNRLVFGVDGLGWQDTTRTSELFGHSAVNEVKPKTIYYYRIFASDGRLWERDNGNNWDPPGWGRHVTDITKRTPLSNIMAVYTSSCTPVTLSGRVYQDIDQSGGMDSGESNLGLFAEPMVLKDSSGTVITQVSTDQDGGYIIPNLERGQIYTITHNRLPANYARTTPETVQFTASGNTTFNFGLFSTDPPSPFTQNPPQPLCDLNNNPYIDVGWNASDHATDYRLLVTDSLGQWVGGQAGFLTGGGQGYRLTGSNGLTPGSQYGFIIQALNPYSNSEDYLPVYSDNQKWSFQKFGDFTVLPTDCASLPSSSLILNVPPNPPNQTYPVIDIPRLVEVKQGNPAALSWSVSNVTSASFLNQPVTLTGGSASGTYDVSTQTLGSTSYSLTGGGPGGNFSKTVQVTVVLQRQPYIEFHGAFHTNEFISMPKN